MTFRLLMATSACHFFYVTPIISLFISAKMLSDICQPIDILEIWRGFGPAEPLLCRFPQSAPKINHGVKSLNFTDIPPAA